MNISFNPKEVIAAVINLFVTLGVTISGGSIDQASAAGSIAENIVNGVEIKKHYTMQYLVDIFIKSTNKSLNYYELTDDCKYNIINEISEISNIKGLLQSTNPYDYLKDLIIKICIKSPNCDIKSFPVEKIVDSIILNLDETIKSDSELTVIYTNYLVREIYKDVKNISNDLKGLTEIHKNTSDIFTQLSDVSYNTANKYIKGLSDYLFAEDTQVIKKTIADVYIDSRLLYGEEHFEDFESLYKCIEKDSPILIEGEAGMGKSTLVMKLAEKYLAGKIFNDKQVFFVCGKDIRNSNGNPEEDLKSYLSIPDIKYINDCILILDAYDEISYASQSQEHNQKYIRKLCRCLDGAMLIITCRTEYIRNFSGTTARILGFNSFQRKNFLEKYNFGKEKQLDVEFIEQLSKEHPDSENIDELLEIPMLLYMIVVSKVDLNEIKDRYSLYEKVFGPNRRNSILRRNRKISKNIWNDCYMLAKNIAHKMFMINDHYISQDMVFQQIDDLQFDVERAKTLKNCFGMEIFLRSKENQLFTFVHNSINEYFAAKWICETLHNLFENWIHHNINKNIVINDINKIFNADCFNNAVFRYVMENISGGYFTSLVKHNIDDLFNLCELMNYLITSQLCISGNEKIPYAIRLKNMILWVFNTFNVIFGMVSADGEAYWVKTNIDIVSFLLRSKEQRDAVFLSHIRLENIDMSKADMGVTYIIDAKLDGADLSYTRCDGVTCISQTFKDVNFQCSDWSYGELSNCKCNSCIFAYSDFTYATIAGSCFNNCDFSGTQFNKVIIENCNFKDCDLNDIIWSEIEVSNCQLENVKISISDWKELCQDNKNIRKIILLKVEEVNDYVIVTTDIDTFVSE